MKRFAGTTLLAAVIAVAGHGRDDLQPQPRKTAQEDSRVTTKKDKSDVPPSGAPEGKARAVSREGVEYLQKLRKNKPFGANGFDLKALRGGMGTRRKPTIDGVKLIRTKVGDIPCEWVLAPGADPDLRLLYLHGGGFVSGSGGFYLPLAAHISAAAKCAVLLPDYRLAPEHRFPAGLEDCVRAHEWMVANGPDGPAPARATFIAGDSAGGNLTLATLLALRDRRLTLPAPAAEKLAAGRFCVLGRSRKDLRRFGWPLKSLRFERDQPGSEANLEGCDRTPKFWLRTLKLSGYRLPRS